MIYVPYYFLKKIYEYKKNKILITSSILGWIGERKKKMMRVKDVMSEKLLGTSEVYDGD